MTPPNIALYAYFRRSFDFRGRSSRSDYWWPRLFTVTVNLILLSLFVQGGGWDWLVQLLEWSEQSVADRGTLSLPELSSLSKFAATFMVVFALATFFADLSLSFRRFHDLGQPGWLHLPFLFFGTLFSFVLIAQWVWFAFPGTTGQNRYGPDPVIRP